MSRLTGKGIGKNHERTTEMPEMPFQKNRLYRVHQPTSLYDPVRPCFADLGLDRDRYERDASHFPVSWVDGCVCALCHSFVAGEAKSDQMPLPGLWRALANPAEPN